MTSLHKEKTKKFIQAFRRKGPPKPPVPETEDEDDDLFSFERLKKKLKK